MKSSFHKIRIWSWNEQIFLYDYLYRKIVSRKYIIFINNIKIVKI
jgi:hypothetical protein